MYDKSVRRRRVALALLVASALLLLTVYFGESAERRPAQRAARGPRGRLPDPGGRQPRAEAGRATSSAGSATRSTAKGEVSDLKAENAELRRRAIAGTDAVRQNRQLEGLLAIDRTSTLAGTKPVTARVIGQSPTLWYSTVVIDQGTGRGVRVGQPVITGDGLDRPGHDRHRQLGGRDADHRQRARRLRPRQRERRRRASCRPATGGPDDLRMKYTTRRDRVEKG